MTNSIIGSEASQDYTVLSINKPLIKIRLLYYFIWAYVSFISISVFKLLTIWLIFDKEIKQNTYYGFGETGLWRYSTLFYLPEPYVEGRNFKIFVNLFFFIFNLAAVLVISVVIVSMETDLECIYRNTQNSEISLFTLEFYNIPREKYIEFEHLIINHLCLTNQESKILSICHVFDLREYFNITKNTRAHETYVKEIIIKEHLMPEEIEEGIQGDEIENQWNRKTLQEIKRMVKSEQNSQKETKTFLELISEDSKYLEKDLDFRATLKLKENTLRNTTLKKREFKVKNFDTKLMKIKTELEKKEKELYMNKTFVSFKSLNTCVDFLKMWLRDRQQFTLATDETKYDYVSSIKTKIAPFIDEIRWENYFKNRRFYIFQLVVIISVSLLNYFLEYNYNLIGLNIRFGEKTGFNFFVLLKLAGILTIQILLVIIAVIILQNSLEKEKYGERSQLIEVQFSLYNILIIVNNIIVVFYGFMRAARFVGQQIGEEEIPNFIFYVNLQWLKNSSVVIFLPLGQRFVGDYLLKSKIIPFFKKKYLKLTLKKESKMIRDLEIVEKEIRASNSLEEIENHKKFKLKHDFGLNSSYIIQMFFLTGFYLPLTSPAHHFLVFLGIMINYHLEKSLLKSTYQPSKYVTIGHIFNTVKFSFVSFCGGCSISLQNSHVASFIFGEYQTRNWSQVLEVGRMVSLCCLTISVIFMYLLQNHNIMLRLLSNLKSYSEMINWGGRTSDSEDSPDIYYKEDFEFNNYKEQNPFYTLMEMTAGVVDKKEAVKLEN